MDELNNQWRNFPILIGVIGQTDSGTSTLIQRLLGFASNNPKGPVVGEDVKEYRKDGTSLVYIDLPDVHNTTTACDNSTHQQMNDCAQRNRLHTIDFFILLSQNTLNQKEEILTKYITSVLKKNFLFVETKMDEVRQGHKQKMGEIKDGFDAVENLVHTPIPSAVDCPTTERIFFISNDTRVDRYQSDDQPLWLYDNSPDYEFDLVMEKILEDMLGENGLAAWKMDAFILATGAISQSVTRAIANTLRKQSRKWSNLSAVIGAIPNSRGSLACDTSMIIGLAASYFKIFGLESSRYLQGGNAAEKLKNLVRLMSVSLGARTASILATAVDLNVVEENNRSLRFIDFGVRPVLGVAVSFVSIGALLRELINFCEKESLEKMRTLQITSNQGSFI